MKIGSLFFVLLMTATLIMPSCGPVEKGGAARTAPANYENLVSLFLEFRDFQKPPATDGVPDYSPTAIGKLRDGLRAFKERLAAMDVGAWPVSQQVDYHLVRAEMNGLDFYLRVVRPWSRDPCFYLPSQGGAGPVLDSGLRMPDCLPVPEDQQAGLRMHLRAVPEILRRARKNLTEAAHDLARFALWGVEEEIAEFTDMATRLEKYHPDLAEDARLARDAVGDYGRWLEENKDRMTAPAGVGKENYTWWLKNVHYFPYTWEECRDIVNHEDNRVVTFLKMEENRNRRLPALKPVASQAEYKESVRQSLESVMKFLRKEEIFTVEDDLTTDKYFGSWHNFDAPWPKVHDYFFNFSHRESLPEETHEGVGHFFDELRHARDRRPIRGARRLYDIDWTRSEGFAFALEELLMHAGYLDERPRRSREIVYQQAAFRNCRALADLYMHSQEFTLEEAMSFAVGCAPRGDLLEKSHHLRYEMQTTLRAVGWHMGMVVGKAQFMKLIRDRAKQLGDDFSLRRFLDEFFAAGMIPMSLIRWEMTGNDDEIRELLK